MENVGARSTARWQPRSHGHGGGRQGRSGRHNRGGRRDAVERPRPNFFVGFRIVDSSIVDNIQQLQQRIVEHLPEIERCMVDARTLHVTLCVLRLPDERAIQQAVEILHQHVNAVAIPAFVDDPPAFAFRGLEFFGRNHVLYTPLDASTPHATSLAEIAESLHDAFDAAGFTTEEFRKPFVPHLTIWKTSQDRDFIYQLNRQRRRDDTVQDALAAYLYETESHATTAHMGTERPTSIELLSMGEKEPDGYYKTHACASLLNAVATDVIHTTH